MGGMGAEAREEGKGKAPVSQVQGPRMPWPAWVWLGRTAVCFWLYLVKLSSVWLFLHTLGKANRAVGLASADGCNLFEPGVAGFA